MPRGMPRRPTVDIVFPEIMWGQTATTRDDVPQDPQDTQEAPVVTIQPEEPQVTAITTGEWVFANPGTTLTNVRVTAPPTPTVVISQELVDRLRLNAGQADGINLRGENGEDYSLLHLLSRFLEELDDTLAAYPRVEQ